jgi:acetate kinase
MNVLVLNCGSSSLKYRLIEMPGEKELAGGEAQRVGAPTAEPARIVHNGGGRERTVVVEMRDHTAAFAEVMKILGAEGQPRPDAIAHRIVHGGARFAAATIIDERVVAELEELQDLAPLHNPPATALVKGLRAIYPDLPQVAVFDTAFHATIPYRARTYALPRALSARLGIRKYGFHGTSHRYVAEEAARFLSRPLGKLSAVSCHLGSGGASLAAIVKGRSVDNTMGFSPLQGLVMSTRSGDLDPAVTLGLLARAGGDTRAVEGLLNKRSGVLGMSGASADIRDVFAGQAETSAAARATEQVYLWRLRKYLGAYLAVVGKADCVIFTDTIGETVSEVRQAACAGMEAFGVAIDERRNREARALPADVATDESPVRILVIRTNEELAIARSTYAALGEAA